MERRDNGYFISDENVEKGARYLGITAAIFLGIRLLRVALWLPGEC